MRIAVIFLLILAILYLAAIVLYIYNTSTAISSRASMGETPNLGNLPRNLTGEDLYLTYRVDGYVDINGSLIYINNVMVNILARYTRAPEINTTSNATAVNITQTAYYKVSAIGDQAIRWALERLITTSYNISQNASLAEGWEANSISDIFGNLSLFTRTGEGQLPGASGITYTEYSLNTDSGVIIIRIMKNQGIPLECVVNTTWGNLRFKLISAS
ncbi:hypothetical protein ATG_02540 [Desulfurococcaceae archaeon AG1]|jgi:hypothetical protein|nr:MAG: hypothetical protein DJ555_06505 [Desulfurococcaceae archaeon]GAY25051.1 hypothetical protein ATG_02540 [Desulfurococcaceae archaeon AG1]